MRVKLQLVICDDDDHETTVTDIVTLKKDHRRIEHLGLTLQDAKQLLTTIQKRCSNTRLMHFWACACPARTVALHARSKAIRAAHSGPCLGPLSWPVHDSSIAAARTARRPRSAHCPLCSLSPLPPSSFDALMDFLPLDVALDVKTVRHDALKVAERCEAELGAEQWSFIDGCPRDWGNLPIPDGPITVGIDGGYVRDWGAKQHNFEVIVGKSTLAFKRDEEEESPSSKSWTANRNGGCMRS